MKSITKTYFWPFHCYDQRVQESQLRQFAELGAEGIVFNPPDMAAMMGGGGENPMAAMAGGQAPEQPQAAPKPKKPDTPEESLKKKLQGKQGGNSPDSAPEATKIPKDMDFEDDVNKDSEHEISEEPEKPKEQPEDDEPRQISIWDRLETKDDAEEKPRGGVGVIIMQGGKVLTGTRIAGDAGGYGLICGPGGHIEPMETPEEAAYRETEEEFGIRPVNIKELGVVSDEDKEVRHSNIFVATEYTGTPKCDDEEMREPVWRDFDSLRNMEDRLFKPFLYGLELLVPEMLRTDSKGDIYLISPEEAINSL